jgi:hypothetical protein
LLPRIVAFVAPGAQVPRVGAIPGGPVLGPVHYVEAALAQELPALGRGIDPETAQAVEIRHDVGLSDQRDRTAGRGEVVAERPFRNAKRHAVPVHAMVRYVPAGVEGHPRGSAYARLDVGTVEATPRTRQAVEVRGAQGRVAIHAEMVPAQLVAHDEEHVAKRHARGGFGRHGLQPALPVS